MVSILVGGGSFVGDGGLAFWLVGGENNNGRRAGSAEHDVSKNAPQIRRTCAGLRFLSFERAFCPARDRRCRRPERNPITKERGDKRITFSKQQSVNRSRN